MRNVYSYYIVISYLESIPYKIDTFYGSIFPIDSLNNFYLLSIKLSRNVLHIILICYCLSHYIFSLLYVYP